MLRRRTLISRCAAHKNNSANGASSRFKKKKTHTHTHASATFVVRPVVTRHLVPRLLSSSFFFFLDSSTSVFLSPDLFPPSSHWTSTALLKVIERMLRGVAAARVYVLQRHALTLTGKKRKPRKRNSEPIEEKKQNNNWIAFQTKIKSSRDATLLPAYTENNCFRWSK